jgi:hypothetical protein
MSVSKLVKNPSAFVPPAMSLAALATVLLHVARFGTAREPDEGAAAHIWQLLMAGQLPVIGYFAMTWLPRATKDAMAVLAIQLLAIVAAVTPVLLFRF